MVIKSIGFEIITNKELRNSIIGLYENWHTVVLQNQSLITEDIHFFKRNSYPNIFDQFQVVVPNERIYDSQMIPNSFGGLKTNQKYKYVIQSLSSSHVALSGLNGIAIERTNELIQLCKDEIGGLK